MKWRCTVGYQSVSADQVSRMENGHTKGPAPGLTKSQGLNVQSDRQQRSRLRRNLAYLQNTTGKVLTETDDEKAMRGKRKGQKAIVTVIMLDIECGAGRREQVTYEIPAMYSSVLTCNAGTI